MAMVIFMKENGEMIKQMAKDFTCIPMGHNMMDVERMINKMVMVRRSGLMELIMKAIM